MPVAARRNLNKSYEKRGMINYRRRRRKIWNGFVAVLYSPSGRLCLEYPRSSNIPTPLESPFPRLQREWQTSIPSMDPGSRILRIKLFNGKDRLVVGPRRGRELFFGAKRHPEFSIHFTWPRLAAKGRREGARGRAGVEPVAEGWFTSWKVSRENQEYYRFCRMRSWIILGHVKYLQTGLGRACKTLMLLGISARVHSELN